MLMTSRGRRLVKVKFTSGMTGGHRVRRFRGQPDDKTENATEV